VPRDQRRQALAARADLLRRQLGGRGGRARHHVRDPDPALQQQALLRRVQHAVGEPTGVERLPEAVAGAGEVVARPRRPQPRVDARDQQAQVVGHHVGHGQVARRLELLAGGAARGR